MSAATITEHTCRTARHTTHYLQAGPQDGPLLIFTHGWPELAISWRRQLECFAALGFRAVAPDMRGYGRSSVPADPTAYTMEAISTDMVELIDHLERPSAVWVGHDWGSPVAWTMASHHAERCTAVASLCVPYQPRGFAPANLVDLVDREVYPADKFPVGQWDYQYFYIENLALATRGLDADPYRTIKALMRSGNPAWISKPAPSAALRRLGGWFGPDGQGAPDLPRDASVLSEEDLCQYASALARNGFSGPDSWYVNPEANIAFARQAPNEGRLDMPVLFVHAAYDSVCETLRSPLAGPMRTSCPRLTEAVVESGHWMQQQMPLEVNAQLTRWLAAEVPGHWPTRTRSR